MIKNFGQVTNDEGMRGIKNGVRGLLSKREIELIERDRYNKSEFNGDYRDAWCYGDERVEEIHSEWNSLNDGFLFEDDNN